MGREEWVEKALKELSKYRIVGDEETLASVFRGVIEKCARVARTESEFKQCIRDAAATLKAIAKRL